jgi:cell wall-associated NlpC family hydrolase
VAELDAAAAPTPRSFPCFPCILRTVVPENASHIPAARAVTARSLPTRVRVRRRPSVAARAIAFALGQVGKPYRLGINAGGGLMVEAPFTGANVRVSSIRRSDHIGAVRPTR